MVLEISTLMITKNAIGVRFDARSQSRPRSDAAATIQKAMRVIPTSLRAARVQYCTAWRCSMRAMPSNNGDRMFSHGKFSMNATVARESSGQRRAF